jgi:hypothetical protein
MNQLLKLWTKQALKDSWAWDSFWGGKFLDYFIYIIVFGFCTFFIGLWVMNVLKEIFKYLDEIKEWKKKVKARSLNKAKVTHKEKHEFTWVAFILGFLFPYYMWAIGWQSIIAFIIIWLCFIFVITFWVIALIGESKKPKSEERNYKWPIWVIVWTLLVAALVWFWYRLRTMPIK